MIAQRQFRLKRMHRFDLVESAPHSTNPGELLEALDRLASPELRNLRRPCGVLRQTGSNLTETDQFSDKQLILAAVYTFSTSHLLGADHFCRIASATCEQVSQAPERLFLNSVRHSLLPDLTSLVVRDPDLF